MMKGYQNQDSYAQDYTNSYQNSGWNYTLFGFDGYSDQTQSGWTQYGYNYPQTYNNWVPYKPEESPYTDTNNEYAQSVNAKTNSSNMLKAKKSGRVFYPSKVHHSRHNSHDAQIKGAVRQDLSPLNRSHDSTCDSSSGCTDSSSKDGSGSKVGLSKHQSEMNKNIVPIKLSLDDEPSAIVPSLIVEVVSSSEKVEYELEQDDVRKVFEKFGPVSQVEINGKSNKAFVRMENLQNGQQAEKYLNFYQLPETNAYLTVKWQFGDYECLHKAAQVKKQNSVESFGEANQTKINKTYQSNNAQNTRFVNEESGSLSADHSSTTPVQEKSVSGNSCSVGVSKECTSVSKFTCKYEIPIRNLPGFSVARKIIGHRGKNMKSILDKLKDNHFAGPIQDVIKLRLRGQGSGFKEGPHNCESPEPLHLCVSSKYHEKYTEACKLVEKLLKDVYQEYNNYCRWRGKYMVKYNVKKLENSPACYLSNYSSEAQQ